MSPAAARPLRYPTPMRPGTAWELRRAGHRAVRLVLPLALLAAGASCAGRAPAPPPYLTPLAWEAREPGAGPVYLLGSIHVGSRHMRQLHPDILAAWSRSEELVVEVDLDAASGIEEAWRARAYLPPGDRLEDVLSVETWALLEEHLKARGIDPGSVSHLKPWAVLLRLAHLTFKDEGFPAEYGVDRRFLDDAGAKPVIALESYELQLDLYDGFSYEEQEMMLRDLLEPEDPFHTAALVQAWSVGNEQAFVDLLFPDDERWSTYQERFFYERNERMALRLQELARDGKTRFVVVGVGHMVGPHGIPALLAGRGFRVERIGTP